jgi:hypothetical protein
VQEHQEHRLNAPECAPIFHRSNEVSAVKNPTGLVFFPAAAVADYKEDKNCATTGLSGLRPHLDADDVHVCERVSVVEAKDRSVCVGR